MDVGIKISTTVDADIGFQRMRLGNQKNGWKNVCIHQEANGCEYFCPVRALGRRVCHTRRHTADRDTLLSAYWHEGVRCDVTDGDMRESI